MFAPLKAQNKVLLTLIRVFCLRLAKLLKLMTLMTLLILVDLVNPNPSHATKGHFERQDSLYLGFYGEKKHILGT